MREDLCRRLLGRMAIVLLAVFAGALFAVVLGEAASASWRDVWIDKVEGTRWGQTTTVTAGICLDWTSNNAADNCQGPADMGDGTYIMYWDWDNDGWGMRPPGTIGRATARVTRTAGLRTAIRTPRMAHGRGFAVWAGQRDALPTRSGRSSSGRCIATSTSSTRPTSRWVNRST